jgi:hypothetical protein
VDPFLTSLAQQGGLLGTLLSLAIVIIGIVSRLLLKEKDKRIEDANKYRDDLVEPIQKQGKAFEELAHQIQIRNDRNGL